MAQVANESWKQQSLPIDHLVTALNLAEEWGIPKSVILDEIGMDLSSEQDQKKITVGDYLALINHFDSIGKLSQAGMELGWRMPPTAYGALGFALLCCENLRQGLSLCDQYWPLVTQDVSAFTFMEQSEACMVHLDIHPNLTDQERRFWLESSLISWKRCVTMIQGRQDIETEIWFDFDQPEVSWQGIEKFGTIQYNMPINQIIFPDITMDAPLPMRNPVALETALKQCEQELLLCTPSSYQWLARMQQLMVAGENGYPSLSQLAKQASVSERTLRRHLQKAGSSYQRMLETARKRDAVRLLGNAGLTIQRVAELLGYADPANFTRRFRHWAGATPLQFRQRLEYSSVLEISI